MAAGRSGIYARRFSNLPAVGHECPTHSAVLRFSDGLLPFLPFAGDAYPERAPQGGHVGATKRIHVVAVGEVGADDFGGEVFADAVAQVGINGGDGRPGEICVSGRVQFDCKGVLSVRRLEVAFGRVDKAVPCRSTGFMRRVVPMEACAENATVGLQDAAVVDEFSDVVVPNIEAGIACACGQGEPRARFKAEIEGKVELAPPAVARVGDLVEKQVGLDVFGIVGVVTEKEVGKFVAAAQFFGLVVADRVSCSLSLSFILLETVRPLRLLAAYRAWPWRVLKRPLVLGRPSCARGRVPVPPYSQPM